MTSALRGVTHTVRNGRNRELECGHAGQREGGEGERCRLSLVPTRADSAMGPFGVRLNVYTPRGALAYWALTYGNLREVKHQAIANQACRLDSCHNGSSQVTLARQPRLTNVPAVSPCDGMRRHRDWLFVSAAGPLGTGFVTATRAVISHSGHAPLSGFKLLCLCKPWSKVCSTWQSTAQQLPCTVVWSH
ncbi:hypothetical protein SKAU_G00183760 [Synaphobranchus kaupii]|uniref:Uncharacterized protein n=1 Tax=Synaphobranchus kaupii TaxID=118154 RepID=A0A9Q1IUH5_SYNKA|nr:hypothetical protein SKAU_G00183760 [Synaphobranchus kaupii]